MEQEEKLKKWGKKKIKEWRKAKKEKQPNSEKSI